MHIKHIHETMENLSRYACEEASKSVESIDTCELEKVVDMVKDLAEAEYYARISKAMQEAEEDEEAEEKYMLKSLKEEYGEEDGRRYYDMWRYKSGRFAPKGRGTRRGYEPVYNMTPEMYEKYPAEYYRDMDRQNGRMYYTPSSTSSNMGSNSSMSYSGSMGGRDGREGRSGISRRSYMETKQMHANDTQDGKNIKAKKLDEFFGDLYEDMKEMAHDMSNEEKTVWKQRVAKLNQLVQ